MKTKQLLIAVILLVFSACKKDLKPGESTNVMEKAGAGLKSKSLVKNALSDSYNISTITTTYPAGGGILVSHNEQTNYTYNPDGKINRIVTVSTTKNKIPRRPVTTPPTYDTLTNIINTTLDYIYTPNTVRAKWVSVTSSNYISHWESTYILDDAGKVTRDTVRIFNNASNSSNYDTEIYSYQNTDNTHSQIRKNHSSGIIYLYNLVNGNLGSESRGDSNYQTNAANYSFYTDKNWQPADALTLNAQLSEWGYAPVMSRNLSQSVSANLTDPNSNVYFTESYGLVAVSAVYNSSVDVKFAYEYDNLGRITKITETGRTDRKSTTAYQLLRTRVITYLN